MPYLIKVNGQKEKEIALTKEALEQLLITINEEGNLVEKYYHIDHLCDFCKNEEAEKYTRDEKFLICKGCYETQGHE